jgi:hypothetical protein
MFNQTGAPRPEDNNAFVIYDDGSTGRFVVSEGVPIEITKPGRFVDRQEYEARLEELTAIKEAHISQIEATIDAEKSEDYRALISAGVPETTARRLSGYQGVS